MRLPGLSAAIRLGSGEQTAMAKALHRSLLPQIPADLRLLAEEDEALVDAALQAITDLAEHRKTGKLLGDRHVSGDLTGVRRLKFDLPDEDLERYRIVYRLVPDEGRADTVEVIAVGRRGGHAVYLAAVERLADSGG